MNSTAGRDHKARGWRGAAGRLAVAGVGLWSFGMQVEAGELPLPGCLDGGDPAVVAGVEADLTLRLRDGRVVILAGIDVPPDDGGPASAAQKALGRWLTGRDVAVRALAAEPDRWGRTVARVFAAPGGGPSGGAASARAASGEIQAGAADVPGGAGRVSVAEAMLEAGLARAKPDGRTAACAADDLALERGARDAKLGLWGDARNGVIPAGDRARLRASVGSLAIVEGRIVRVAEGRARTYLAFGPDRRADFAIAVDRAAAARLAASGMDLQAWRGRPVRVRGFLDDRFGLQIELTSTDQIEFTDRR